MMCHLLLVLSVIGDIVLLVNVINFAMNDVLASTTQAVPHNGSMPTTPNEKLIKSPLLYEYC